MSKTEMIHHTFQPKRRSAASDPFPFISPSWAGTRRTFCAQAAGEGSICHWAAIKIYKYIY